AGEQLLQWAGRALPVGQVKHVAWVSHGPAHVGRLFVDGQVVNENLNMSLTPADLGETLNDWLGRSQFNDPFFKGSFDEFRIHQGAMSPAQVAASFAAGTSSELPPLKLTIQLGAAGELIIS